MATKVKIDTAKGVMIAELYDESTPITVNNFKKLIGEGIYTNDGVKIPMSVKVGDKVMMPFAGSAQKVKLGDEEFLLFREQELLMVIR